MVDATPQPSATANRSRPHGARVAILMRTRNRPVLLARAIGSVLSQEHQDWHLLLVNDGGDAVPVDQLLLQYETGLAGRVAVSHRPPTDVGAPGMAADAALALVDEAGRFDFLCVHDDDDCWHPAFLTRAVGWLLQPAHDAFAAVCTRWELVREQADRDGIVEISRQGGGPVDPVLRLEALLGAERIPPICVLLRRHAVPLRWPFGREPALLLRVASEAGDIGVLPELLAAHHRRTADCLPDDRNRSGEQGAAGNPEAAILRRNAGLRAMLRADPAALTVLDVMAARADAQAGRAEAERALVLANLDRNGLWGHARHEDLQARLIRVEHLLSQLSDGLAVTPGSPPEPPGAQPPSRPLWKRAARRLAGPLIDRVRRHSA